MDLASLDRWQDYTDAKEAMLFYTDSEWAPWTVVRSNDKKRGRLEAMRWVLATVDYPDKDEELVGSPDPNIVGPPWTDLRDRRAHRQDVSTAEQRGLSLAARGSRRAPVRVSRRRSIRRGC